MAERRPSLVRRVAWWVLGLPVLVVAVLFAIENKGDLALRFWPTPYVITLPVWAAIFGAVLVGFFFGGPGGAVAAAKGWIPRLGPVGTTVLKWCMRSVLGVRM